MCKFKIDLADLESKLETRARITILLATAAINNNIPV